MDKRANRRDKSRPKTTSCPQRRRKLRARRPYGLSERQLELPAVCLVALAHRYDASVRDLAHRVLELDRRMVDAEMVIEPLSNLSQDAFTG